MDSRYLTDDEKARHLAYWQDRRAEHFERDEPGAPDPDIYPLVDFLNSLSGVCTVQSCAGHVRKSAIDGADYLEPAHLWIRASAAVLRVFQANVRTLMEYDGIERCAVLYHRELGDLIDLEFHGNERGRLALSITAIELFFFGTAARATNPLAVMAAGVVELAKAVTDA